MSSEEKAGDSPKMAVNIREMKGAEKHENNSATPYPSGGGSAPSEDREGPDACIASCSKISPSHSPPLPTYVPFVFLLFPPLLLLLLPGGRVGVRKVRICTSSSTTTSSYKHFCSLRAMEHVYQIDNCQLAHTCLLATTSTIRQ